MLARCLFPDTNSLFLKLLFPHICFVCIWSLMIIGYFTLVASLNLSPRCEGHVSLTLVFQSLRGLYTVATEFTQPFFLVDSTRFERGSIHLKNKSLSCCRYPVDKSKTGRKWLQITYVTQGLCPEYGSLKTNSSITMWAKDLTKEEARWVAKKPR